MLLRLVADRLQRGLRAEDTLARLGGDEFAVLIEDVEQLSSLETVAEKLLEAIRQPTPIRGITGRISGSFGIAVYPDNAKSPLELMRYADIALYSSKDAGRDRVSLFNDDLEKELVGSLAMEQELRKAIERSEFVPFFQPRYGCCDNHLYGVEVLARWAHPTQGILLPAEFMHVAEKAGLMLQMDRALIRKTLGLLRDNNALPSEDAPYRIAFNITAAQLLDTGFADEMASLASEFGVAANLIEFEIVEDILVERHARDTLHALRKAGFGLAIDDFGTGFSSFAYLRDLPVTALKLDRSFVRGLDQDRINRGICEAIVCAGKRLDLIVIGEGVENQGELDSLRELGVDSVQGFLLARPMKPEQWIALQRALKLEGADGE
jgi:predicted signal transduction protein with EAL and GGDEF domain